MDAADSLAAAQEAAIREALSWDEGTEPGLNLEQTKATYTTGSTSDIDNTITQILNRIKSSFEAGDDTYAIDIMYQPVLEGWGGKEVFLTLVKAAREMMNSMNIEYVSWNAKKPYQYLSTEMRQYVVAPYEAITEIDDRPFKQVGYILGIRSNGVDWQFLNGDRLDDKIYEQFFPDFPREFKLPPVVSSYQ